MNYDSTNARTLWSVATAVAVLTTLAVWQFYLFVTFKDTSGILDLQGGRGHLYVAISASLLGCIAAFFALSAVMRYDSKKELHIT